MLEKKMKHLSLRFSGFNNMHVALRKCNYSGAADEMYDSVWRTQVSILSVTIILSHRVGMLSCVKLQGCSKMWAAGCVKMR